ncbi:MAG TPA: type I restriction enzyme HsdR N-terminal domain-containing protein [Saprospiraceae bacterium]|nr:type I restriction enzyme HsdR N-terminal domain-containing protein [Saprospiraceae bacterium]
MINIQEYSSKVKVKVVNQKRFIWDIIRKKWLILQPEEFVRQIIIHYLIENGYPQGKITVERSIQKSEKVSRYDILVYDKSLNPFLLVECKAFNEKIKPNIDIQLGSYNTSIKSPFLCITNGIETRFYLMNEVTSQYINLLELPTYPI